MPVSAAYKSFRKQYKSNASFIHDKGVMFSEGGFQPLSKSSYMSLHTDDHFVTGLTWWDQFSRLIVSWLVTYLEKRLFCLR